MNTSSDPILTLLHQLYPAEQVQSTYIRILELLRNTTIASVSKKDDYFSERNITLITYADTLQKDGEAPLQTLHHFLREHLKDLISTLHILPFYPYSSDDGFAVIDYYKVNSQLGNWDDIRRMSGNFRLMFDAVINHMSAQSPWFQDFLNSDPHYERLFLTEAPEADLREVTRPRTTPLLTPFRKADGSITHVWTTFSADQVDLDYRDPETLLRILKVLLFYIEQGAHALRLDAIAYLWKQTGTKCIHLPQTHAIIKLIRAVLDRVAPEVVLITETNVPHAENISYFGDKTFPEAQLVYNFTLPPLLFYSMVSEDARPLAEWVNSLGTQRAGTAFLNFTASHDGIGVRPVEGILTKGQIQVLIEKTETSGGRVSYKSNPDGIQSPYELNITYLDAVTNQNDPIEVKVDCFLVSQAIMLALAGIPAIYIHSLLGSRNDIEGRERTGHNRAINRKKLMLHEVGAELNNTQSLRSRVFNTYQHLIRKRRQSEAFHPNALQNAAVFNNGQVFALERATVDGKEQVLCLFNMTGHRHMIDIGKPMSIDVLTNEVCSQNVLLGPYQVRWLTIRT
jgi:sucrose phosphorylase